MSVESQAGNAILALASTTGVANFMTQADTVISIVVGILSAVGIVYSIIWHRVRINAAKRKSDE